MYLVKVFFNYLTIYLRDVGEPLYLTPLIQSGDLEIARTLSLVTDTLDGLNPEEQPESYSGFLTVKEDTDSNMFFWFVPATVRSCIYSTFEMFDLQKNLT